ncbi:MAG: PhnD/SsuA/transferrin family substrate-binding protein [Burkholderiales bacterium]
MTAGDGHARGRYVVNARMYAVSPAAADAWRSVLHWVVKRAQVAADVLDYPPPKPLPSLWARDDLGGVFMCGHPFSRATPQPRLLAAPVPSPAAYGNRPVYWTCLVAREDSGIRNLADTFARRMAYTTPDSQSGYLALRALVADAAHPFSKMVGPLVTPRRVIEAVIAGEADAGPVDSYALGLLALHEPALVAPLRVVAASPPTPIPPLVASPGMPAGEAACMRDALLEVAHAPALVTAREALLLRRFATVDAADYDVLREPKGAALL